ncbi:MAG: putative 2OG-Fe(II) oxygenase [Gammaproteobacteria bacterium]|nr:putative 2OG-Fe(II) oxygenase [Gammaproteobacteria bacterium]
MTMSLKSMNEEAQALRSQGKHDEAIELFMKAAAAYPTSAVAEHNLAAALGDFGRADEAETHIRRAFAKGLKAPESWLVLARALLAQGRLDEAREAFEKTIELSPLMLVALYEYAQLIWMTTGDSAAAIAPLNEMIKSYPDTVDMYSTKARVMMYTSGAEATYRFVTAALERWPDDVKLLILGIDSGTLVGEAATALEMSDRLVTLQPASRAVQEMRAQALLASGRAEEAVPIAEKLTEADPNDQHALALLATVCRLVGDSRYQGLYDYDAFVRAYKLTPPDGWASLDEYLSDLGAALRARHPFKTHPFSNSEEHGSKISDLLEMDDPAIKAIPKALAPAVNAHLVHLGTGTDPLRSRNTGRWKIDGIWSVWLKPNGFHHDHVHPTAWLSSACYIELPDEIDAGGQEGWIKFGEPGTVTSPKLAPEHAVKPEPGMLVLFPSYMWHGTIPFGGDKSRLSIALDIVPD